MGGVMAEQGNDEQLTELGVIDNVNRQADVAQAQTLEEERRTEAKPADGPG
jgi:hypothetical protein